LLSSASEEIVVQKDVVLVTGAGGCIAAWVMKELHEQGVRVVGFDLSPDRRRAGLAMDEAAVSSLIWETGDIADGDRLKSVASAHAVTAIIHLAALQVPFCKADPVAGAKVNVLGTVNVLETARHLGLKRLAYASSIAVQGMYDGSPWLASLYGAHKACGEAMAKVYWNDWRVPSVGIRPGVVYGPGRDQGMSAAPTVAMLAAVTGAAYEVPYTGPFPFLYVREAASAFVAAVSKERTGARVFDLNGVPSTIEEALGLIKTLLPDAPISGRGAAFPFPAELSDEPINDFLGSYRKWALKEGVAETLSLFRGLVASGKLGAADVR
jgi:nucleoside-diphosphate-sugar epimerase